MMFSEIHYVPILKAKQAELLAVKDSGPATKNHMTPLFEMVPVPWDFENEQPSDTTENHLAKGAKSIRSCWNEERPVFIDMKWIEEEEGEDGTPAVELAFAKLQEHEVPFVPVLSLANGSMYRNAVRDVVKKCGQGLCLRLRVRDTIRKNLKANLEVLLKKMDVAPSETDVIFDLGAIQPGNLQTLASTTVARINNLPYLEEWRTLTLASGAFPPDLSSVKPKSSGTRKRADWLLWRLVRDDAKLSRRPAFADYAIEHPDLRPEVEPWTYKNAPKLRYTLEKEWLLIKGSLPKIDKTSPTAKSDRYADFRNICQQVVSRPDFKGAQFSWGDNYIQACANGKGSTGNPPTWRRIGFSHHLAYVADQLSSFSSTSSGNAP